MNEDKDKHVYIYIYIFRLSFILTEQTAVQSFNILLHSFVHYIFVVNKYISQLIDKRSSRRMYSTIFFCFTYNIQKGNTKLYVMFIHCFMMTEMISKNGNYLFYLFYFGLVPIRNNVRSEYTIVFPKDYYEMMCMYVWIWFISILSFLFCHSGTAHWFIYVCVSLLLFIYHLLSIQEMCKKKKD